MVSDEQQLRAELRALRKGRGITLARLKVSSELAQALDTSSPSEMQRRLIETIRSLGSNDKVRALLNAYGVETPFDNALLTVRRGDFAMQGMDVAYSADTIEAWENEIIDDVVALLLARPKPRDILNLSATVHDGSLVAVHRWLNDNEPELFHTFVNPPRTMPMFLYGTQVDQDSSIDVLGMLVTFTGKQPLDVWCVASNAPYVIMQGLETREATYTEPNQYGSVWTPLTIGHTYGICWRT